MATTLPSLLRVSLRASRGSSHYACLRLLSTVASPGLKESFIKPSLVLGGGSPVRVNGEETRIKPYEETKSDLVVVLDLDECLVHSQFFSPHAARLAHQLPHGHASSWNYSTTASSPHRRVDSFRITLPDGDIVHVNKRPHLETFLEHVTSRYETHVFTAAMEVYASPVLDKLDPTNTMFDKRWYRESCAMADGAYIKDLGALNINPERTVLVDNNPISFLANPENGILVNSFYNDPEDETLRAVLDLLDELDETDDVRPVLEARFGLKEALEDYGREEMA